MAIVSKELNAPDVWNSIRSLSFAQEQQVHAIGNIGRSAQGLLSTAVESAKFGIDEDKRRSQEYIEKDTQQLQSVLSNPKSTIDNRITAFKKYQESLNTEQNSKSKYKTPIQKTMAKAMLKTANQKILPAFIRQMEVGYIAELSNAYNTYGENALPVAKQMNKKSLSSIDKMDFLTEEERGLMKTGLQKVNDDVELDWVAKSIQSKVKNKIPLTEKEKEQAKSYLKYNSQGQYLRAPQGDYQKRLAINSVLKQQYQKTSSSAQADDNAYSIIKDGLASNVRELEYLRPNYKNLRTFDIQMDKNIATAVKQINDEGGAIEYMNKQFPSLTDAEKVERIRNIASISNNKVKLFRDATSGINMYRKSADELLSTYGTDLYVKGALEIGKPAYALVPYIGEDQAKSLVSYLSNKVLVDKNDMIVDEPDAETINQTIEDYYSTGKISKELYDTLNGMNNLITNQKDKNHLLNVKDLKPVNIGQGYYYLPKNLTAGSSFWSWGIPNAKRLFHKDIVSKLKQKGVVLNSESNFSVSHNVNPADPDFDVVIDYKDKNGERQRLYASVEENENQEYKSAIFKDSSELDGIKNKGLVGTEVGKPKEETEETDDVFQDDEVGEEVLETPKKEKE